jgi:hypothetical protein
MTPHHQPAVFRSSGAALLLALWAMFILSAAVLVWAAYVQQTIQVAGEQQVDTEARAMAHSGLAIGMHPLVKKETPALKFQEEADPGFRVQMVSNGGKLNITTIFAGEDARRLEVFKKWLEYKGLEFDEREHLVDCILDYLDADNVKHLNGQEDDKDYHPANRGTFTSVEEIAQVAGSDALTRQPGWKDDLTIFSSGPIDLTAADEHILRLLPGVGDIGIERFLQWRRGVDGIDGTIDDPPFDKLEQAQPFLGMDKNAFNALGGLIGPRDSFWEIKSEGWSGKVHRKVTAVVKKGGQNPLIYDWKE